MKHTLLLGSNSDSRKMLLKEALIPFEVVGHTADESKVPQSGTLEELVLAIARYKMKHVLLPKNAQESAIIFVLTADSMGQDAQGVFHGKPKDRQDAIEKIKKLSESSLTATGFCLEKKEYKNGTWHTIEKKEQAVATRYAFTVPENWIERYLQHSWAHKASGAIAIELYGAQFLKWIEGSYSTVVGLPMYELRQALDDLGFF